jgi:hypothetical protein
LTTQQPANRGKVLKLGRWVNKRAETHLYDGFSFFALCGKNKTKRCYMQYLVNVGYGEEREEKIKQMELSSQKLEAMYTDLKTARTLSLYDKDIKDTKQKLSGLVREIDKCIALLNE